jgi:glycosyltransferase involved in cell wall biosynthesis
LKILLLSYYFAPGNIIGAVRFTKLSKYFQHLGCDVTAYCGNGNKWLFLDTQVNHDEILQRDIDNLQIRSVTHSRLYQYLANKFKISTNKNSAEVADYEKVSEFVLFKNAIKWVIKKNIMLFLSLIQDIDFTVKVFSSKAFRDDIKATDCIVTTYGPYSPHIIGLVLKVCRTKIQWVADFRDPIHQPSDPVIVAQFHRLLERAVCRYADKLVCVSSGYLESVVAPKYRHKAEVITNGFDTADLDFLISHKESNLIESDNFLISYTGTTYAGRRDLSPLLGVLKKLTEKRILLVENIEFHYAGPEYAYISDLFCKFGLNSILINHGMVPRKQALSINKASAITIVATWDDEGHRGVLPGKLYELMMFNAAVLAMVSTNIGNSEISKILANSERGFCFESNQQNAIQQLEDFIQVAYEARIKNSASKTAGSFKCFSYLEIAKQYLSFIKD